MPRLTTDLTPLLSKMKEGRKTAIPGKPVQGTELAEMAGMTWRVLKSRILRDAKFPVLERGANGKAWSFDAAKALDYLIADIGKQAAQRKAMKQKVARRAGMASRPKASQDEPDEIAEEGGAVDSAIDIASHARALTALSQAQMNTHKLKQLQGEVVSRERHVRVVETIMSTMQNETLAIEAKLDPGNLLPPDIRGELKKALRDVLLVVNSACERNLKAMRG